MARRAPFIRPPVLLVANAGGTWTSQALANLIQAREYRVHFVSSGRELVDRAAVLRPDVIVLDADLPDVAGTVVCATLRENPAAWNLPIVVITSAPATKQQRLAALEAGATDYLSVLVNPDELALKLDAMARVKIETDRRLEENVVDTASGLYTTRGLERRARELAAEAFRRHAPLACVALGVEPDPKDRGTSAAVLSAASAHATLVLRTSGRTSDCIGELRPGEFAVLAPGTGSDGAVKLAQRLTRVIEAGRHRPAPPLRVRAGYDAVADAHATPFEPASLIEHADAALRQARSAEPGERIRAYQA
ncbi:MAG TPA: response regulator [Gemmatimonadales bacterium]|nr:response regulator [Gemmatimonadales bacterium]